MPHQSLWGPCVSECRNLVRGENTLGARISLKRNKCNCFRCEFKVLHFTSDWWRVKCNEFGHKTKSSPVTLPLNPDLAERNTCRIFFSLSAVGIKLQPKWFVSNVKYMFRLRYKSVDCFSLQLCLSGSGSNLGGWPGSMSPLLAGSPVADSQLQRRWHGGPSLRQRLSSIRATHQRGLCYADCIRRPLVPWSQLTELRVHQGICNKLDIIHL